MYKIKPSLLESWRILKDEIFEKDVTDFIKQIKGEFKPTKKMEMGTLIHSYLDDETTEMETESGILSLQDKEIDQLYEIKKKIGFWFSEVPNRFNISSDILISCIIDKLFCNKGAEIKTGIRFRGVDFYDKSLQWKCYSMGFNLDEFTYYHISILGTNRPYNFILNQCTFYPYKEMERDVISESYHFIDWCKLNNLEKYITYGEII
jgi:hypothetical protein